MYFCRKSELPMNKQKVAYKRPDNIIYLIISVH